MVFILESHKQGAVSTGLSQIEDKTADSVELLPAIDFGLYGNPDGANGMSAVASYGNFMSGHPQGPIRNNIVSGQGNVHPANQTSAPMSSPFMASPSNSVSVVPSTIAV